MESTDWKMLLQVKPSSSVKVLKVEIFFMSSNMIVKKITKIPYEAVATWVYLSKRFSEPSPDSGKDMCPENLSHKEAEPELSCHFHH